MSISRQALAAALLEYDNENLPQYAQKDHRRSAIFSLIPPKLPKEYTLPAPNIGGEDGHHIAQVSGSRPRSGSRATQITQMTRRPQSGMGMGMENGMDREVMDGPVIQVQGDEQEDVDIDRWDLPDHLVTEEARPSSRQSQNQVPMPTVLPQRQSMQSINIPGTRNIARSFPSPITSPLQARAVSVHLEPGEADIVEQLASRAMTPSEPRRRTISFETNNDLRRRTYSDLNHADSALARSQQLRVSAAPRASSVVGFPMHDQHPDMRIQEPVMVPLPDSPSSSYHPRPMSSMSRGSRGTSFELDRRTHQYGQEAEEEEEALEPNPFALPAPTIENASRFDPKATATLSTDDLLSVAPSADLRRPMSTANLARLNRMNDGTATPSEEPKLDPNDPLGILVGRPEYDDLPSPEAFGKSLIPNRYGRRAPMNKHDLLRPKTLVMPSTLTGMQQVTAPKHKIPEGFIYGDKPLPAGARSSILTPHTAVANLGDGRTFGAAVAAEQQEMDRMMWEAEEMERLAQQEARRERMPGKLYGTSLMDQLEARKLQMRGKQRQFGGDSRPAMMARLSMLSFPQPPDSPGGSPDKGARAPLLSFDSNGNLNAAASPDKQAFDAHSANPDANRMSFPHPGMPHSQSAHTNLGAAGTLEVGQDGRPRLAKSKSVFGVDTIWEREMAKLKIMQEAEAKEKAEREEQERARMEKKGNRKSFWAGGKGKEKAGTMGSPAGQGNSGSIYGTPQQQAIGTPPAGASPGGETLEMMQSPPRSESAIQIQGGSPIKRAPDAPPMLQFSPEKKKVAPRPVPSEEEAQDVAEDAEPSVDPLAPRHLGTFASGQQVPPTPSPEPEPDLPLAPVVAVEDDESSDEEVPLSKLKAPTTTSTYGALPSIRLNSDISGSLGLSVPVLPPSVSPRPPSFMGDALANFGVSGDEEDDDVPLGVRQSRLMPPSGLGALTHKTSQPLTERPEEEKEEIEDDLPLGFKHAAAVSRRVASGTNLPTGQSQQQQAMSASASMYGYPNQMTMGMGGMGFPQSPSVYGTGMPGMHMGMGMPNMGMGMGGMGMPSMYGNMGMPMGGMGSGMGMPQGQMGMMQGPMPPTEMPGANIDSWRKGVRAPSTVGGESRASGAGMS